MKKVAVFVFILFTLVLIPVWASAGSVEGKIQGLTCVTTGKLCPVDEKDPMAKIEKIFVVLTAGKNYYFVPNVKRAFLVKHINQEVRVSGEVSKKYPSFPSIKVNKIEVLKTGTWKSVWLYHEKRKFFDSWF